MNSSQVLIILDLLLINPRTELEASSKQFYREPPNGILQLFTTCRKQGFSVEFIDLSIHSHGKLQKALEQKPKVIGLTCLTNTYPLALKIARIARDSSPDSKIIFGGPHVSFLPEKTLLENSWIDLIAVGEAENSLPSLLHELQTTPQEIRTPGITWRKRDEIIQNAMPPPVNLEEIPMIERQLIKNPKYLVASIVINRGCPYKCSFCVRQRLFPNVRIRSIESVVREFHSINEVGYEYVNLYDNVNLKDGYMEKFCREYKKKQLELPWGAEIRIDKLSSKQAALLKEANCQGVAVGIESGSKEVLQRNGKVQDLKLVRKGVQKAINAGIVVQAYFVIGLPGETTKTFHQTLEFLYNLDLQPGMDRINFFIATPYPGSDLYSRPEHHGISLLHENWELYDTEHVVFETKELPLKQFDELVLIAKQIEEKFNR